MRQFTLLWLGYLIAEIGDHMAWFAITLWVWDQTGLATALTLTGFFYQLSRIFTALFAGIFVNRTNRKRLHLSKAVFSSDAGSVWASCGDRDRGWDGSIVVGQCAGLLFGRTAELAATYAEGIGGAIGRKAIG